MGGEPGFEVVDGPVPAGKFGVVGPAVDPVDQHVLVVRTVEDPHHPGARDRFFDPPQEVVRLFLVRGSLEGRQLHALGIHGAHHVAHDAALARGVHGLQDQQDALVAAELALREELFLQFLEAAVLGGQQRAAVGLGAGVAGCGFRVHGGQPEPWRDGQGSCRVLFVFHRTGFLGTGHGLSLGSGRPDGGRSPQASCPGSARGSPPCDRSPLRCL